MRPRAKVSKLSWDKRNHCVIRQVADKLCLVGLVFVLLELYRLFSGQLKAGKLKLFLDDFFISASIFSISSG
jgi:hypothetical protein